MSVAQREAPPPPNVEAEIHVVSFPEQVLPPLTRADILPVVTLGGVRPPVPLLTGTPAATLSEILLIIFHSTCSHFSVLPQLSVSYDWSSGLLTQRGESRELLFLYHRVSNILENVKFRWS